MRGILFVFADCAATGEWRGRGGWMNRIEAHAVSSQSAELAGFTREPESMPYTQGAPLPLSHLSVSAGSTLLLSMTTPRKSEQRARTRTRGAAGRMPCVPSRGVHRRPV